jgi:rod shape-determining protein MreC
MRLLLGILRLFKEYIVLAVLCSISLLLIAHSDSSTVRILRSVTVFVFGSFQTTSNWFGGSLSLREENEALRDMNMTLMEEVMQLRRFKQENSELRALLHFKNPTSYTIVPGEVVGRNLSLGQNTITVDIGDQDSVRVNMPVINEQGLVGKVIATSSHFSIIEIALHRDFRSTARVKRSGVDGIIAWKSGEKLLLQNIWKTADIVLNDTIVTSTYSSYFPPELPIGVISSIGPGTGGLYSKIEVEPFASFPSLRRVFVIRYAADAEHARIEEEQILKLRSGGK